MFKIICIASFIMIFEPSNANALIGPNVQEDLKNKFQAIARINDNCTATLISKKILITAAHCVYGSQPSDLEITFPNRPHKEKVARILLPNFLKYTSPIGNGQDIALLYLEEILDDVKPINLGLNIVLQKNDSVLIAGYGRYQTQDSICYGQGSEKLLIGETTVQEPFSRYPSDQWGASFATSGGAVVCSGDSGGPALLKVNGEFIVVGIISSGDSKLTSELSLINGAHEFLTTGIEILINNKLDVNQKFEALESDWISTKLTNLELTWEIPIPSKGSDKCELIVSRSNNQPFTFQANELGEIYLKKIVSCKDELILSKEEIVSALKNHNLYMNYEVYPINTVPVFDHYPNITTLTFTLGNHVTGNKKVQSNCTYFLNQQLNLNPVRQDFGHHCTSGVLK
jgi:hypothetical protein